MKARGSVCNITFKSKRKSLGHFVPFYVDDVKQTVFTLDVTATRESPWVEIVKRFSNDNILQYFQQQIEITNKKGKQWFKYCRDICTAQTQNIWKQLGGLEQEFWRMYWKRGMTLNWIWWWNHCSQAQGNIVSFHYRNYLVHFGPKW